MLKGGLWQVRCMSEPNKILMAAEACMQVIFYFDFIYICVWGEGGHMKFSNFSNIRAKLYYREN